VPYLDGYEQAIEFARAAQERMARDGIPPSPENFALWYGYYSGRNLDLVRAIDTLASARQPFTPEKSAELHARFIGHDHEGRMLRETSARIQETLGFVATALDKAGQDTGRYGARLADFHEQLSADDGIGELRRMVEAITAETRAMSAQNLRLGQELESTSRQMERMRSDLDEVRREAMTDGLTGIANRKFFDLAIDQACEGAAEPGKPFSLLMVDIDHFKIFNDTYGHQTGDEVLKLVARVLKDTIKGQDVAARYGGEEFAIILPGTEVEGAVIVGDQIRERMATRRIVRRTTGEKLGSITLSIGAAQHEPGEGPGGLVERADTALYKAKGEGRNRVIAAPARLAPAGEV
jgi:diguanylate cyclase